jgi:hypothetical protein
VTADADPIRAVQRAAVDRAVAGDADGDPARHLAFAGALEAARGDGADVLGSALASTAVARALAALERHPRLGRSPWTPRAAPGHDPDPWLVEGAALVPRFTDLDAEAAADLADLPVATVEAALRDSA